MAAVRKAEVNSGTSNEGEVFIVQMPITHTVIKPLIKLHNH